MIVAFAKSNTLAGLAIRLFTWSRWNHCGAVTKDKKFVIEATAKNGVVKTPIDQFIARYESVGFGEIPHANDDYQIFLYDQVGKDYDRLAILSIVLRMNFQRENKWFCSELVGAASGLFRAERGARVTPGNLWSISKDIEL